MLQLQRFRTHQARLHKQQEGVICCTTMVLAAQPDDTQRCRVPRSETETQYEEPTTRRVQSVRTATESTATREEDHFGYAFVMFVWALSINCQAIAQTTKSMEATADTPRLAPKPLIMLVDSGACGNVFDNETSLGSTRQTAEL